MKRWKIVVGASIACFACLCIAMIAIQAVFGGGMGLNIEPYQVTVKQGSTITYDITISSDDNDYFDVTVIPSSCKIGWFNWTGKKQVYVAAGSKEQISLNVTPSEEGDFKFKVKAVSIMDPGTYGIVTASIKVEPVVGVPCIALTPDKSEPQFFGTVINWAACACDPEVEDCKLCYQFSLDGPGTGGVKKIMQPWSTKNTWRWNTTKADIGDSNIYVDAGDCDHVNVLHAVYKDYTITSDVNYPPVCACLMPDKSEPQHYGTEITWNASAIDPEGDSLQYRFLLSGPGTGYKFVVMQDWRTAPYPNCPTWTWSPSFDDMGSNDIVVEIRDGMYVPPQNPNDYYDVKAIYYDYWIGPAE